MKNIYLIGFMGSGKSAVCSRLHELTGMEVIEMDASIVDKEGMSINDIFATKGEEYFRDVESELLYLISEESNKAVSCGGGAILRQKNVDLMKESGKIILLSATPETIYNRVKNCTDRPLLNGNMNIPYITKLMDDRRPRYTAAADFTVTIDNRSIDDICKEILELMK